jgi:hemerythrin
MLIWSKQFETGVSEIDTQHRQLIQHVNRLEALLVQTNFSRKEIEFLLEFVTFLENYVETHFSYEEDCMLRYRCPAHEKNKQAHEYFRGLFLKFRERIGKEGMRMELIAELNQTIQSWIEGHILSVDTGLRACRPAQG